ncbi:hypothetical protein [Gluconobacter japonicus]|uniref:hypothetical protein n=1 Tax=Gluconobacter japonicus TaxID=376620 RepID=UPI0039EC638B
MMHVVATSPGEGSSQHKVFLQAVRTRLSAQHAGLFATPQPAPLVGQINWVTQAQTVVPFSACSAQTQQQALRYIGATLSAIRRVAETENSPIRQYFLKMRRIPSLDCIFIADGRPVLTQWGLSNTTSDPLAAYDDGQPGKIRTTLFPFPPRFAAAALAGAALGLACGCLLLRSMPEQNFCGKKNGIPEKIWKTHDLSLIKGCWLRISNLNTRDLITQKVTKVTEWSFCFNDSGTNGTQELRYDNGQSCKGPLHTHFENGTLVVEAENCFFSPTNRFVATTYQCTQQRDGLVSCPGTTTDPSVPWVQRQGTAEGTFQRQNQ